MKKYIYGAGKYGKTLFSFFRSASFDIDGFVQSKNNGIESIFDKPIIPIDELLNDDNIIFFLAIKDENITNDIKRVIDRSFPNAKMINCVEFIDDNLLCAEKRVANNSKSIYEDNVYDESVKEGINYRSVMDMDKLIRKSIGIIPPDVDLIVGIPRSGMLPATILSLLLNKPLVDINVLVNEENIIKNDMSERIKAYSYNIDTYKKILVIDDSCNSGSSIEKAREKLKKYEGRAEFLFGCIYATHESKNYVDLYFEIVNLPRVFEWNIMNHSILKKACLDLDGVLCIDPTKEENDDGEKYVEFILNAKPLFVPKVSIGYIVTSRLEKYRRETEVWLEKNGIKYEHLYMLDLDTKEERIKLNAHSNYKSLIYSGLDAKLFIESDEKQAEEISKNTNKDVYCVGNNRFYHCDLSMKEYKEMQDSLKNIEKGFMGDLDSCAENDKSLSYLYRHWETLVKKNNLGVDIDNTIEQLSELLTIPESYDEERRTEIKVLLRHFSQKCLREMGKNVSDKAWKAEMQMVYKNIEDFLVSAKDIYDDFQEEISYLKNKGKLQLYPYDFTEKYDENKIEVIFDKKKNLPFVYHKGAPLYYPNWPKNKIRQNYNQLIMEQDEKSPHCYFSENIGFEKGSIFVDIGSAEGIISLDIIEKAKKIFIIESSEEWMEALQSTFSKYKDKISYIKKYAGLNNDQYTITIDELMKAYKDEKIYIKMDVEGMELDVLAGAKNTLKDNYCKISCATYHYENSFEEVAELLNAYGYATESSDGYMLFYYGHMVMLNGGYEQAKPPFFRKAIIRAKKELLK